VYSGKTTGVQVRRPSRQEVDVVGGVLADAFVDDPIESWSLRCADVALAMRVQFLAIAQQAWKNGWLWTTDNLDAAAIWVPPDGSFDMHPIREANREVLEQHGGDPNHMDGTWQWIEAQLPPEPSAWRLDVIAVEHSQRNRGIGTSLLRHGIDLADEGACSVTVGTGRKRLLGWYLRHGFQVLSVTAAPDDGPMGWFMRRPPTTSTPY
jgi:GNAT superfamily N-acetyltransferase